MVLRHGGLFEGYGGTTMAAHLVLGPMETQWVSDIKPAAVTLLEHRAPGALNLGDMTAVDYTQVAPVDLLTASWPCQPHSAAGKRLGEKDPRALWPHVARAVAEARPAVFLGENVARITSNGELRRVVRSLADLGYVGAWRCVRASDVGAPHRRDRCFVAAVDPAAYAAAGRLAGALDGRWHGRPTAVRSGAPAGAVTLFPTPTARLGYGGMPSPECAADRLARGIGQNLDDAIALLKTPTAQLAINGGSQHPDKRKAGGHGPTLADEVEWLLPTPTVNDSRNGRNATANRSPGKTANSGWTLSDVAHADRWGKYAEAIVRWERVLGREAPPATMPSPRAGGRPVLSPPFVEWMMGVAPGHVTDVPGLTRTQHLSLLGDGVVPQQGAAAFRFLLDHLADRLADRLETAA